MVLTLCNIILTRHILSRGGKMIKKNKNNIGLIIGIIISLLLFIIAINYESIIPVDAYSIDKGTEGYIGDEYFKIEHPLPPNDFDKLGTDPLGRNVLSLLIAGTRTTLFIGLLASLFKLLISISIANWSKEIVSNRLIKFFSKGCNIVVEIIIAFLVLNSNWYKGLELKLAILVYALTLGLIGWGRFAKSIKNKDKMTSRIISNYFIEVGRVLIIQFVLGIAGITVGVNKFANIETKWGFIPNYNPEWGGMLATANKAISTKSYWLIIGPTICFAIAIIGFILLGKGILYDVEADSYRKLKKIGLFFSPKEFISHFKNLSRYWESVVLKSLVAILIVCAIIGQLHINKYKNSYQENLDYAYKHIEELSKCEGSGRDKVANYIAYQLKKYNISPLFENEYIQEFDVDVGVKGKNVGGYIRGRNSTKPLVLVTSYDDLGVEGKGLCKNETSVAAILEIARNLKEKSKEKMNTRTIVFLFADGSEQNGQGVRNVVGNEYVDVNSFYMHINYLGLGEGNRLYMDTSTVNSAYNIFYKNIKGLKLRSKELGIPIKQEYLYPAFADVQSFMKEDVSGISLSTIDTSDIIEYNSGKNKYDLNNIDKENYSEQLQLLLDYVVDYAWTDNWNTRGLKASN